VARDWYRIDSYALTDDGRCAACGHQLAGRFAGPAGTWGARRLPVRLADVAPRRSIELPDPAIRVTP
jgi:pyruvate formate lyase activating enzyme